MQDIQGYENLYAATKDGKIWSYPKNSKYTKYLKGMFLKQIEDGGYLYVSLHKDGKQKKAAVHRLVAGVFIPNPDNKPQINHINGIKTDNRVENLEWVTASENVQHAYDNGLAVIGDNVKQLSKQKMEKWNQTEKAKKRMSDFGKAYRKLSKEQVLQILEYQKQGKSAYSVSKIFPISKQSILKIYRKKTYLEFINE